jgi:hypothetical protein
MKDGIKSKKLTQNHPAHMELVEATEITAIMSLLIPRFRQLQMEII